MLRLRFVTKQQSQMRYLYFHSFGHVMSKLYYCRYKSNSCKIILEYSELHASQQNSHQNRPRSLHRGSRGTAVLLPQPRRQMEVGGQRHAPTVLPSRKRPGTHCTGGWVGIRAGLDGCGNSHSHRNSIPGPSKPQRVPIPTALSGPGCFLLHVHFPYQCWR